MRPAPTLLHTQHTAWNPGIVPGIPHEFRMLETLFRKECASTSADEVAELAGWTGLPAEELTALLPARLALHEVIIRVTADIGVREGEEEEAFGRNFRDIASTIFDRYVSPHIAQINDAHTDLARRALAAVEQTLRETLFHPLPDSPATVSFFSLFRRRDRSAVVKPRQEFEYDAVAGFKAAGLNESDPLQSAVFKSLYRVLGSVVAKRGTLGGDCELLTRLVARHVCNTYGGLLIGQRIDSLVNAAIEKEGYERIPTAASPVLISLKGASAAGKSSLRPMLKDLMAKHGIEPGRYMTISPDVWRRMLLDYAALGPATKYAGYLTSREIAVIDGKLDRYIRRKAERDKALAHLVVDRFRFDSFASEKVGRVLHDTYAKYVDTLYMYFVVTPPEETVERGWQRGLERGRYKAVEDFLGHCVEAYTGMPKLLFKWLGNRTPDYYYTFLDNLVPRGTFPKTIAEGDRSEMIIYDPVAFTNIERYQNIEIRAKSPTEVYGESSGAAPCSRFLLDCLRRIPTVSFAEQATRRIYATVHHNALEIIDEGAWTEAHEHAGLAKVLDLVASHFPARKQENSTIS